MVVSAGRPAVVKTEQMVIDLKYTHVHIGRVSKANGQEDCEYYRYYEYGPVHVELRVL
jgi:hypothetical protein